MTLNAQLARKLTYDDYVLIPDDGRRHEIVGGVHLVNPAPSIYHQTISSALHAQLYFRVREAGLGVVFAAPIDVELSAHDVVQPDLVVVAAAKASIILASRILGAPSLLVEILSPATQHLDRFLKRERYAQAGVLEYWIVDPVPRIVERYVLRSGEYAREPDAPQVALAALPTVEIDVTRIW